MAHIKRVLPERLQESRKLLTVRSTKSEIAEALTKALDSYMILASNRSSILGSLIRYAADEIEPKFPIDIVGNQKVRAYYIKCLTSFMTIELAAFMSGIVAKKQIASLIQTNIEQINSLNRKYYYTVHKVVEINESIAITVDKMLEDEKVESVIFTITNMGISCTCGTISNRHNDADTIRETQLI